MESTLIYSEIIGYGLAVLMGITLGLIGAGGSILAMPILVYFLNVPPVIATGYSLLIVGVTALVGTLRYYQQQLIDFKVAFVFAIPALCAVYSARAWLLPSIPHSLFSINGYVISKDIFIMLLFSGLMMMAAILMIKNGSKLQSHQSYSNSKRMTLLAVKGSVIGLFTGMVGAGGGFLIIGGERVL